MPIPSAAMTCTIAVGDGALTVGGLFTMAATTISSGARTDILTINSGTVNFNGGVTTGTTGCIISFTSSGVLNMAGTISTGPPALTEGTGTINYKGTTAQSIWIETYYNLIVSGSSTKTLRGTTTITNLFTVNDQQHPRIKHIYAGISQCRPMYCGR